MSFVRVAVSGALAAVVATGSISVASAAENAAPYAEEHQFTGSSTSAAAFQKWFAGEEFVKPSTETRDLSELKVNDFETAHAGDVVYKDDQGRFWIKQHATIQ